VVTHLWKTIGSAECFPEKSVLQMSVCVCLFGTYLPVSWVCLIRTHPAVCLGGVRPQCFRMCVFLAGLLKGLTRPKTTKRYKNTSLPAPQSRVIHTYIPQLHVKHTHCYTCHPFVHKRINNDFLPGWARLGWPGSVQTGWARLGRALYIWSLELKGNTLVDSTRARTQSPVQ